MDTTFQVGSAGHKVRLQPVDIAVSRANIGLIQGGGRMPGRGRGGCCDVRQDRHPSLLHKSRYAVCFPQLVGLAVNSGVKP